MSNLILSIIVSAGILLPNGAAGAEPRAVIDRVEDGYAAIELSAGKTCMITNVPTAEINTGAKEGAEIPLTKAEGRFYGGFSAKDLSGREEFLYQFRSDDNEIWWALTKEQLGFTPDTHTRYKLWYSDNGTTKANPPCDCPAEYECECSRGDDIFLGIEAAR